MSTRSATEISKLNYLINQISKSEFLFEQISTAYINKNLGPNFLLEALSLFELGLLFYRVKKYTAARSLIYLSEAPPETKITNEEKQVNELFSFKLAKVTTSEEEVPDLKQRIKLLMQAFREGKPLNYFNKGFTEDLPRCGKKIGLVSKLPLVISEESFLEGKQRIKYRLAEALYLIRPVIYCFAQIFYGEKSYRPYLISLILDLLRMIMESRIKFSNEAELKEFKKRNKDVIINYLLRNPFYTEILRNRILDPLLDKLFPRFTFIKKIIIYIIEIRSSLSILM